MQVTTTPALPIALKSDAAKSPAAKPESSQPQPDEFKANSPDKNRIGYEVAYNFGSAMGEVFKGVSKAGQFVQLTSSAMALQPGKLAGSLGLMGGTLDVAIGASIAKQGTFNHNNTACLLGGLQVAAGVATWGNVLATTFGAPALVGRVASVAALGLIGARYAAEGVGKVQAHVHKDEPTVGKSSTGLAGFASMNLGMDGLASSAAIPGGVFQTQAAIKHSKEDLQEMGERKGQNHHFENTFAAVSAVDNFGQKMGGMGSLWANVDALRNAPVDGIWSVLGLVGGTYGVVQGISTLKYSAINHNQESTVEGALSTIQGAGTVGAALGLGRAAGAVALGAWVAKTGYSMYAQAHKIGVGGKNDGGESMTDVIWGNLKNSFWGESKETFKTEPKKVAEAAPKPKKEEEEPKPDTKPAA